MNFYLLRKGEPPWRGPFSEEALRAELDAGRAESSDLCWSADLGEWRPIAEAFPAQARLASASTNNEPSDWRTFGQVAIGMAAVFAAFAVMNLLSHPPAPRTAPYASAESAPAESADALPVAEEFELYEGFREAPSPQDPSQPPITEESETTQA